MPDELEIDTDKLHETIHEELERGGRTLLMATAPTTALFAALGAVAALWASSTVNEAVVLKTEAIGLQEKNGEFAGGRPGCAVESHPRPAPVLSITAFRRVREKYPRSGSFEGRQTISLSFPCELSRPVGPTPRAQAGKTTPRSHYVVLVEGPPKKAVFFLSADNPHDSRIITPPAEHRPTGIARRDIRRA